MNLSRNNRVSISNVYNEYNEFISKTPPTRLSPNNPVVVNDGTYENICPGGIVVDPLDSTKFIFYCGEFFGSTTVGARISYFIGNLTDPYTLGSRQGIALAGTPSTDDQNGTRFGCVLNVNGVIYYWYVGVSATYKWRIFLATSSDGRVFTKQGMVLDFNNVDEKSISDPSIVYFNGVFYMIYTCWDGLTSPPNNNPGKSTIGLKSATSTDGINWTKGNLVLIAPGINGTFDDNNAEGGQLLRFQEKWVILYNANDGTLWSIGITTGVGFDRKFSIGSLFFSAAAPTAWDDRLVAVPLVYDFPSGTVMYYQALSLTDPLAIDVGAANLIIT